MRPPWLRALTGCLQMIVRSADDVEVDAGEVEVGQLRQRAFNELCAALDDGQRLSLAWIALADLAVWPQLSFSDAKALARAIESGPIPTLPLPRNLGALSDVGARGAADILSLISAVTQSQPHRVELAIDWSTLRTCVNRFAKNSTDPIAYWEKWLRRVVPAVITHDPASAKALAVSALNGTLNAPARWHYRAFRAPCDDQANIEPRLTVCAASPGRDWHVVQVLGSFVDYQPLNRKLSARFLASVPIDRYRMGYLLRSTCMTDLLDDQFTGHYDSVVCVNSSTGERWDYARL